MRERIPAHWLADCEPEKVLSGNAKPVTGDLLAVLDSLEAALALCNLDKATLRAWDAQ